MEKRPVQFRNFLSNCRRGHISRFSDQSGELCMQFIGSTVPILLRNRVPFTLSYRANSVLQRFRDDLRPNVGLVGNLHHGLEVNMVLLIHHPTIKRLAYRQSASIHS